MDDVPVGGGNSKFMEEQPSANAKNDDADKPLEERLLSKNWNTRADAYVELQGQFKSAPLNCANDSFKDHATKWPNYLSDNNPGSLEKAIDLFQTYLEKVKPDVMSQNQIPVLKPVVEKCLGHMKPVIKTKSLECIMVMFEVTENFEAETMDALEELCKSKLAKVQQTAVGLLASLMQAFGIKKFPPSRFNTIIENAANNTAPAMRTEAINCYKAMYLWLGEAVETLMNNLKPAQKEAAVKEFAEHKEKNKNFKRLTRSEKAKEKEKEVDALIAEESKNEVIDVYDIAQAKDILKTFTPEWIEEAGALKVWSDKRDRMIQLFTESDVPKLEKGNYADLVALVKKCVLEANIVVSQNAIKAAGVMAKGIRESFAPMVKELVPSLIAKFKERKLIDDIQTSLTHCMMCLAIDELWENLAPFFKDKSPQIKQQTQIFIEKALMTTYIDNLENIQGELLECVNSLVDDKEADVREQALKLMGVLQGRLGQPAVMKYTDGMIPQKKAKIEEAAATVKPSKYDKSAKKAAAEAAAKVNKKPVAKPQKPKPVASDVVQVPEPTPEKQESAFQKAPEVNDFLIVDEQPKVLKKPPPNIGKKPEPKPKPPAEEKKTAPAPAKPTGKAPAAPAKDDEDAGGGLDKEESIEKCEAFYSADHISKLKDDAKWQDKQEGFKGIQSQIEELKPDSLMLEATARYVKAKMKDWKESNINLMKEAIQTLKCMTEHCDRIPKRAVFVYSAFLCDKLGDVKVATTIKELLMTLTDFVTAKFVASQIIKHGSTAKAPKTIENSCDVILTILLEWGAGMMPVKECIDFGTLCAANPNAGVRTAAMKLFAELYHHLGEAIRNFLTEIKESTMKVVEEEFKKITPYKKGEFKSSRVGKGDAAEELAAAPAGGDLLDCMPREDISKQLTSKLLAGFKDKDWKVKKETADQVGEILKAAKMRVEPNGLGELMECLKAGMKEANKAVLKSNMQLLGSLAEAVGAPIKTYLKKCFEPMIFNLSDKQSLVRNDTIEAVNKWAEAIGNEPVVQMLCVQMETENPELRDEGFKWILAHKEGIKGADHQLMVKPLMSCLTDKVSKIRSCAEEVIVEVMAFTGFEPFARQLKDLKPAVQQAVKPILDKARAKCVPKAAGAAPVQKEEHKEAPKARPQTATTGPTLKTGAVAPKLTFHADPAPKESPQKQMASTATGSFNKAATAKPVATGRSTAAPEEEEFFVVNPGSKEKRAQVDAKVKWMHEELKTEQIDKVRNLSEQIFGLEFTQNMFSADFKKHLKVIAAFGRMVETQPENLQEVLDIIFKWCYIKMTESQNTTFLVNVFDFFLMLFEFLVKIAYQLWDHEAYVLVPLLCDKSGINNSILQEKVKLLIKECFRLHDAQKTFNLIIKFGVGNKNLKSVAQSLDELTIFISNKGIDFLSEKDMQLMAKLADSPDKGVRDGALSILAEVYKVINEDIWRVLGQITIKVKGLLEGRLKQQFNRATLAQSMSNTNILSRSINQAQPAAIKAPSNIMTKSISHQVQSNVTPRAPLMNSNSKVKPVSNLNKSINNNLNLSINSNNAPNNLRQSTTGLGNATQRVSNQPLQKQPITAQKPVLGRAEPQKQNLFTQEFNQQNYADDDLELIQQLNEIEAQSKDREALEAQQSKQEVLDPVLKEKIDNITKHIQSLKYGDLTKRVDSLVALNEIISNLAQHEDAITRCANELCGAFTHVLIDIFERPLTDIPLRFAKYFITIVNKACQCKELMFIINEAPLYDLTEQLLTRLLIEGLDRIGDQKEGEQILKNLNASMLRLMDHANPSHIFCVLFNLLRKFKEYQVLPKLPGLIIKCLLKLSKVLEKTTTNLDMERVLLVIHEYLCVIDHNQKTPNDEMGVRIVKTVINELVKVRKETIWESYKIIEIHRSQDHHIKKWINIILTTEAKNSTAPQFGGSQSMEEKAQVEREIKQIIDELRATDQFEGAIPKLHKFLQKNPREDLNTHLKDLSAHFSNFIKTHLETYQKSIAETGSTQGIHKQAIEEQPQDSPYSSVDKKFAATSTQEWPKNNNQLSASAMQNSRIQQAPQTAMQTGSTGAAVQQVQSDRLQQYQDKLSTMRDRFKNTSTTNNNNPAQAPNQYGGLTSQLKMGQKSESQQLPNARPATATATAAPALQKNNSSLSAMNSSLSQKWSAVSKTKQEAPQATETDTNTVEAKKSPRQSFAMRSNNQLQKSNNAEQQNPTAAPVTATSQDLAAKLAEMKAKFQALKK